MEFRRETVLRYLDIDHKFPSVLVYRYFKEEHGLQALQEGRLKVGRLFELNDPLDCQPSFVNFPATYSRADRSEAVKECLQRFNDRV